MLLFLMSRSFVISSSYPASSCSSSRITLSYYLPAPLLKFDLFDIDFRLPDNSISLYIFSFLYFNCLLESAYYILLVSISFSQPSFLNSSALVITAGFLTSIFIPIACKLESSLPYPYYLNQSFENILPYLWTLISI